MIAVIPVNDATAFSAPGLSCNCSGLIDGLIYQESFPNFTQWANDVDVVHKVNTNVTETFPQWADNVVHNIRESFPNFTQQTNDVVNRVNTNVTLSISKFTELDA